jgi:hypothetical protein
MESTRKLTQRAEQGDVDALFRLGYRIAFGRNRPRPTDWGTALRLWTRAGRAGHKRAQFCVGTCCDHGQGVAYRTWKAMGSRLLADGHGIGWSGQPARDTRWQRLNCVVIGTPQPRSAIFIVVEIEARNITSR